MAACDDVRPCAVNADVTEDVDDDVAELEVLVEGFKNSLTDQILGLEVVEDEDEVVGDRFRDDGDLELSLGDPDLVLRGDLNGDISGDLPRLLSLSSLSFSISSLVFSPNPLSLSFSS